MDTLDRAIFESKTMEDGTSKSEAPVAKVPENQGRKPSSKDRERRRHHRGSGDDLEDSKRSENGSRGGSKRSARTSDRAAKDRSRRSGEAATTPGAVQETSGSREGKHSRKSGDDSRSRNARDRRSGDTKEKERARRVGKTPSVPGAVPETSEQDKARSKGSGSRKSGNTKEKERARRQGNKPSVPGAVAEDSSKDTASRKERRNKSRDTKTVSDDARERARKIKEKEAMIQVQPETNINKSPSTKDEEELPMAAAIDIELVDENPPKQGETEAAASSGMASAPFGTNDAVQGETQQTQDNSNQPKPEKPFYCKAWFWIVLVFICVCGGVGALFALRGGDTSTKEVPSPVGTNTTDPTASPDVILPDTSPTESPTSMVTAIDDPPSKETCDSIGTGDPIPGLDDLAPLEYDILLEVVLNADTPISATQDIAEQVQSDLLPPLAGCTADSASRHLQTSNNFLIKYATVTDVEIVGECEDTPSDPPCYLINIRLVLYVPSSVTSADFSQVIQGQFQSQSVDVALEDLEYFGGTEKLKDIKLFASPSGAYT